MIVVGVWFLLEQLDVIDLGGPWPWIPSFFIVFVFWHMVRARFRNLLGPLVLVGVAALVQLAIVGDEYDLEFDAFWPVVIILIGLALLSRGRWGSGRRPRPASDGLDVLAVFSSSDERISGSGFKGGRVTSIFGAAKIDFLDATIEDRPAEIDLAVTFGSCSLVVPEDWIVDRHATVVFGGNRDKRSPAPAASGEPHLIVTGIVLFGELEIKS